MVKVFEETRMTLGELATELGVSIATVYAWRKRPGRPLETFKVGGKRYTTREAVQRFTEQDEPQATTHPGTAIRVPVSEVERQRRELQEF